MTTKTENGAPLAVARGCYWESDDGRGWLRVLSLTGRFWRVDELDGAIEDPAERQAVADAASAALAAAGSGEYVGLVREGGGAGRWSGVMNPQSREPAVGGGRLMVEMTAAELTEVASGRMPHALRTRVKRAIDAGTPAPGRYSAALPKECKVSTRGRRTVTAKPRAARPRPDAIMRPNGVAYHPRLMDGRTDIELIRAAHAAGISCLMHGAPGTGKTAGLEAALQDFEYVPGTADTVADDFVGAFVPEPGGSFRWVDGPLLRAMERGVPLIIDEVALIDPRILAIVYAPMDGRGELPVVQNLLRGTVKAQPGFGVHGACNPDAPGAMMSEALVSRFRLQVEYGTDYELAEQLGAPAAVVQAARNLEAKRQTGEVTYAPQMRELLAYVEVAALFDEATALQNLVGAAPAQDRPMVADVLSRAIGREVNPLRIGE